MFNNLKHDWQRYTGSEGEGLKNIFYLIFTQGLWAIAVYRFGSWCNKVRVPLVGQLLRIIYFFLFKSIEIQTGISIDCNANIGPGFYIGHFGQIFIYSETVIGEQATIAQGVTIGTLGLGKKGAPTIGNNVFIGAGAKVLGRIQLGHNVHIGANAVVLQDVPDNCTVVGVPGKIIPRKEEK
jgi:serine O-acetyltransferase